jgi:hypothetical protein
LVPSILLGSALALASPTGAQTGGGRAAPHIARTTTDPLHQSGRNVTISLLTLGNGTHVWELFGHNAIWIHDRVTNRDTVFNWGVFNFRQPRFIQRFLKGTMLYSMGGDSMENILQEYRYWNRTVLSQELALTAAQKDAVLAAIQNNALPENINYRYDYFRDNCSTRVRDILDNALGGPLHTEAAGLGGTTYRWHTLRLMQTDAPIMLGVDIGLGRPSDVELTKWQEMFLPRKLHDFVAKARVIDSAGTMHSLVRRETVLFQSTRGAEPDAPPDFGIWALLGGIAVAALIAWLGVGATSRRDWTRFAASIAISLWSLAAGLLGTILVLLWTVTDHIFAHANENVLIFNPLWLGLVVLAPIYLLSGRAAAATQTIARAIAFLTGIALFAHGVQFSLQPNFPIIALGLPPALAVMAVTVRRPLPAARRREASG